MAMLVVGWGVQMSSFLPIRCLVAAVALSLFEGKPSFLKKRGR
jgi:hypothetical protein